MPKKQTGFTLVELMVALVLGLLVIMAATAIFLSNRQVFGSTTSLNRIQENSRAAFEIMARDIREAGGNPCGSPVVSILPVAERVSWQSWGAGIFGTEGGGADTPDTVTLFSAADDEVRVTGQDNPGANVDISTNPGYDTGDIVMVCNAELGSLFRVSHTSNGGLGLGRNSGAGGNAIDVFRENQEEVDNPPPGGASRGYCYTQDHSGSINPNCTRTGSSPAVVIRPTAIRWEILDNASGGRSLFRTLMTGDGATVRSTAEVAAGVVNMQLMYKLAGAGNLVDANGVSDWETVEAVQVVYTLNAEAGTLQGRDLEGVEAGQRLSRTVSSVIAIRNREGLL